MRRKVLFSLILTFLMAVTCSFAAFADEAADEVGISYQNQDLSEKEISNDEIIDKQEGNDPVLTSFKIRFNREIQNAVLKIQVKNEKGEWQDYPQGTYALEQVTGEIQVADFDMTAYGNSVRILLRDANGIVAETAAAEAQLPAEEIAVDTQTLFGIQFSQGTIASLQNGFTYTGEAIEPDIIVESGIASVVDSRFFDTVYVNNVNAGTATVAVTAKAPFLDSQSADFSIKPVDLSTAGTVVKADDQVYTGSALKPDTTVTAIVGGKTMTLASGTDYTASYSGNKNPGTATVTVTGKGNFTGQAAGTFKITKSVKDLTISGIENKVYTGEKITQDVVVKDGTKTLKNGTDYKVSYADNIEAGRATVTITGKGNYSGSVDKTFKITKPVSSLTITGIKNKTYTGKAITQKITVKDGDRKLTENTDYTVSYADNINLGTATVTIKGKGYYTGSTKKTFKIQQDISGASVSGIKTVTYNGKAQTFDIVVKDGSKTLAKGTDYTVSYQDNINAGTGSVIIKGKGNYKNSVTKTFTIKKAKITSASIKYKTLEYNGLARTQTNTTVVKCGKTVVPKNGYSIKYSNNKNPGTAVMTITAKGNYRGTLTKEFTITKYKLKSGDIKLKYTEKTYTGKALKPGVTVTAHYPKKRTEVLKKDQYKVTYSNNTKAGTAKVVVTGLGDFFEGEVTASFKILPVKIKTVTLGTKEYTYDGTAKKPSVTVQAEVNGKTVTLKKDRDYTLSYLNNTKAGSATAVVKGKGNYSGSVNSTFRIKPAQATGASLSGTTFTYTGNAITPAVTVKSGTKTLKKGTDYKVVYSNNINVGTATAKITATGNYTGSFTLNYVIKAKSFTSLTMINTDTTKVMKYKKDQKYPTVLSVTDNGRKLTENVDYTVSITPIKYYDKPNEETGYITVLGKGNYFGSVQKQYMAMSPDFMVPVDAKSKDITAIGTVYPVGSEPVAELLYKGSVTQRFLLNKDFTVVYSGNTKAGTAYVRIQGKSKALMGFDKMFSFRVG